MYVAIGSKTYKTTTKTLKTQKVLATYADGRARMYVAIGFKTLVADGNRAMKEDRAHNKH